MEVLETEAILGLIVAGLCAGFVNTIAGGGSLLTLPALMLAGLPADLANGTNRIGILFQASSASFAFKKKGVFRRLPVGWVGAPTLVGAVMGAWAATLIPAEDLEPILLGSLVGMALLIATRGSLLLPPEGAEERHPRRHPTALLGLWAAGFYGGFVQAGLGFFLLAMLGGVLRMDLRRANAMKAITVLMMTVLALGVFLGHGLVAWLPGLILGISGATGATLGVRFALSAPLKVMRYLVLVAVLVSSAALLLRGA